MRAQAKSNGLTALAVAGTNVVLIGWDMSAADIRGRKVLGFSLQRTREEDGETTWMPGMKTFEAVDPDPDLGAPVSSLIHPLQTFQWSDYSVLPNKSYTYRLVARTGTPKDLKNGPSVTLKVKTERVDKGKHAIFFNRGAVASQEYARRFQNRKPSEIGKAAYDWLSRGLVEGLENFIGQAGKGDELYGAFFEFKNSRIYDALKAAKKRKAKFAIIYDGKSQKKKNENAMKGAGLKPNVRPRIHTGQFAHNKFLVLRRNGKSEEVWTGSTNLSENGIFGHSNNAHLLRDGKIAEKYYQFWLELKKDETKKFTSAANETLTTLPKPGNGAAIIPVFSPRKKLDALDWYAKLAGAAKGALFMTFAFGMNERFVKVYSKKDKILRFALMEKKGNGKTMKQQTKEIDTLRRLPNIVVSVGHKVQLNNLDRWLEEIDKITKESHVLYVHTKYMLIDPLGKNPIVVVGSANFSKASTDTNDENMLVISGDNRIADIYLGEFMRLFSHYAFRESLTFKRDKSQVGALKRKYLVDNPAWINGERKGAGYFEPGTDRTLRREYFSREHN